VIASYIGLFGFYAFMTATPVIVVVGIICYSYLSYHQNIKASLAQTERAERYLTELQESEERYRHSFERFRSAFNHAPIGMALVAPFGGWLQVNRSLSKILGYSEEELLGMSYQSMIHPKDCYNFLYNAKQVLTCKQQTYQQETRFIHKHGHEVWVLVNVSLDRDPQSKAKHLIFQIQDITDRKRAEEQLLHEAFHDALTGLPNRAWFMEQLRTALSETSELAENPFAVMFLDLDRFKIINDSLGHMVGDQLLIGISNRLRGCVGAGDIVARLGGDEFTILVQDGETAIELAEKIQKEVAQPFNLSGYEAFTTASIGIALSNPDYKRPEDLLRDADTAMYHAKSQGKACHTVFDRAMHAHAMNLLQLETDLRRAIDRQEFFIEYQPIVSLTAGRIIGFEALVRWQHPEHGLIVPEKFIGMAEEAGFIVPIGEWVLHEACRQMRNWQMSHTGSLPLTMSVNISSKQFGHSNIVDQIINALEVNHLDPHTLKLEITESVVMESIETATDVLEQLRGLGIGVSIDDFGTGYSSLSYLHRLPIDTLKIDRSFVSHIGLNKDNKEIVRTIIMLAQNLGMEVIAEGVETEEQLERLKELKCHNAQGYLFGRPLSAKGAESLIRALDERRQNILSLEEVFHPELSQPVASGYAM
ncbi:MAG TPA: EAL domain-containing protein, partial [Blastocatellia bacterium]|nr:EAL domain-containing protein [Blastocatellia bacterium]